MNYKAVAERFFNKDLALCKKVNLTLNEIKCFQDAEWHILRANGLDHISGAWSALTIIDIDEEDSNILIIDAEVGEQAEDGKSVDEWEVTFNRKTKEFEKE